jgi:hypothetical protein
MVMVQRRRATARVSAKAEGRGESTGADRAGGSLTGARLCATNGGRRPSGVRLSDSCSGSPAGRRQATHHRFDLRARVLVGSLA